MIMAGSKDSKDQRRIQIKVPENYQDVNDKVWKDLEEYVFTGFLAAPSNVLGQNFVFKTLNHNELRNIGYLRPIDGSPPEVTAKYRSAFIAYSIFIASGTNVLHKRIENIEKIISIVSKFPVNIQEKIVDNLSFLNKKAGRLYPLVEVYVHESRSRFRWLYLKKMPVHSVMATSIDGTDAIGMNYCQQTWMAMNEILDKKDNIEAAWANSKFVGSCFSSKGVMQVDEQDKARRSRERQEVDDLRMKVLKEYVGGEAAQDVRDVVSLPDGRRAAVESRSRAESVQELADQLSASLSGEKDWHDAVIEHQHKQLLARQEELERKVLAPSQAVPNLEGIPAVGGARVLGSREAADEHVRRMQALMIKGSGRQRVSPPDLNFDPDIDRSGIRNK